MYVDTLYSVRWVVDIEGAPGTLYEGERFQLGFKFTSRYPFDSPQVCIGGRYYYIGLIVYTCTTNDAVWLIDGCLYLYSLCCLTD